MKPRLMFMGSVLERPNQRNMIPIAAIFRTKRAKTERHTFLKKLQTLSTLASSAGRSRCPLDNLKIHRIYIYIYICPPQLERSLTNPFLTEFKYLAEDCLLTMVSTKLFSPLCVHFRGEIGSYRILFYCIILPL